MSTKKKMANQNIRDGLTRCSREKQRFQKGFFSPRPFPSSVLKALSFPGPIRKGCLENRFQRGGDLRGSRSIPALLPGERNGKGPWWCPDTDLGIRPAV